MIPTLIPICLSCDKTSVRQVEQAILSLSANASPAFRYHVHVLHAGLPYATLRPLLRGERRNFRVFFENVEPFLESISAFFPKGSHHTDPAFFCFFAAEAFPEYRKLLWLGTGENAPQDAASLYKTDIKDAYVGASRLPIQYRSAAVEAYAENTVGVAREAFFGADPLVINCTAFRSVRMLDRFLRLQNLYDFRLCAVACYLNVLCRDHVFPLEADVFTPDKEAV